MLNLPSALFTKVGAYEIMRTNLSELPISIVPDNSILEVASSTKNVNMGKFEPNLLDDFSFSVEVEQAAWNTGAKVSLWSYMDAAGDNGIDIFEDAANKLTVEFYNAGATTFASVPYDISAASASVSHTITIARKKGLVQKVYWDGALVASDTDATDVIGTPASSEVGGHITSIIPSVLLSGKTEITTSGAHGLSTGDTVILTDITTEQTMLARKRKGLVTLNNIRYAIVVTAATKFEIFVDSSNFETYTGTAAHVNFIEPMIETADAANTNTLKTANLLDANDAEILYQLIRNNLVVRDENGLIKVVTIG